MSTVAARRAFTSAEDWQCTTLGHIAKVKGGKRLPKGEKFADTVTPFPYIRVTDFANFSVDTSDLRYLTPETQATIERYTISKTDVYVSIAGTIGITGMIPAGLDGANLTENAAKLVLSKDVIDPRFLMYYLASEVAQTEIRGQTVKNAQPKLALARIASLEVALPPLSEQRKIAAMLGLVQRAIEQQRRLIALTTELKKTLLHKLFTEGLRGEPQKQTEIGLVPESWEVGGVGDIAKIQSGGTPARDNPQFWKVGTIPWVKTGEIDYCIIQDTEERITAEGLVNSAAKMFAQGTLLMAMYGQGVTRGRVAILGIDATTNQACAAIIPRRESRVSTRFLYYHFEYHYEDLRRLGHGANQKNMNAALIRNFPLALPGPDEQDEIVTALSAVDSNLVLQRRKHATLTALFRSVLHQLMTAQLRVRDLDLTGLRNTKL